MLRPEWNITTHRSVILESSPDMFLDGSLIFPTYFRMELVSRIITNFKKHLNMYRKSGKPARKRSHPRMATFLYGVLRDAEVLEHGNKTSPVDNE